jgi:type I restriction enzyme S subunit
MKQHSKWQNLTLGDVLTFQRGFDITKKNQKPGPYAVISSSGSNSQHNEFKIQGPGVVIGRKGTLGTVFFSEENFWPHDTTLWVKDFHGNDPKFAYYFLKTLQLEQYDCGSSNPTLNRNHIHLIPVQYPPLHTQKKIASILSAYDDLIENNTRRIQILEEMAQMLYQEWFVNFRFPGHEQAKFVESELGPIPEGWEFAKATDAIAVKPRIKVPKEGDKPYIPMASLQSNSMLIGDIETRSGNSGSKFMNGDTLFARITPCLENGKTGYVQCLPSNETVALGSTEFIVLRAKTLCPEMVYLMARSAPFRDNAIKSMTGATGRQRVQEACFDAFLFAHPDSETISKFEEIVRPLFGEIHVLAKKNEILRETRDLLLPKLISGEIDLESFEDKTLLAA